VSDPIATHPIVLPDPPIIQGGIPTSTVTNPATFRLHFPEFANTTVYPDAQVQFYIDTSTLMCDPRVWHQLQQMGVELMTAHMLAMSQYASQGGSGAGVPGMRTGMMTSKSVSKVSVSYDQGNTAMEGWGPWNYTTYGQRYAWLAQLAGTGGYETLALSNYEQAGLVWTWARGVMLSMGS
jgi:hypothetical protein